MTCSLVPFLVVLTYMAQIGGPLISMIGIYSYKGTIYNLFMRKRLQYTTQYVEAGKVLDMKFVLLAALERSA